ncbi:MAG TPA: hypothetical protein DIV79_13885 [Opitutae bacterium]|nr:hypothetical protein [Opitutaceae bacterium]HCR31098.1 hypothetical protein [Opitutae bacterium]
MKGPDNFAMAKGSWPDLANAGEGSSEAMLIIIDWLHPPVRLHEASALKLYGETGRRDAQAALP